MNPLHLIYAQLGLECIGLNHQGLLVRIPGPNPDGIACLYCYHYGQTYHLYFRHDISPDVRQQIEQLSPKTVFTDHEAITTILMAAGYSVTAGAYQSYICPNTLHPGQFPDVVVQENNHQPMYAVVRDGQVASACTSARENDAAGECYVFTKPAYRNRGYARQTTAAWGYHRQQAGKIPFYSHKQHNSASYGVAQSLGLEPCFTLVNYG